MKTAPAALLGLLLAGSAMAQAPPSVGYLGAAQLGVTVAPMSGLTAAAAAAASAAQRAAAALAAVNVAVPAGPGGLLATTTTAGIGVSVNLGADLALTGGVLVLAPTGVAAGSCLKATVTTAGRISACAALASGDITGPLGYVPVTPTALAGVSTTANAALPTASAGPLATQAGATPSAAALAALGYTPYNATNPSAFVNAAGAATASPVQTVAGRAGAVTLGVADVAGAIPNTAIGSTVAPLASGTVPLTNLPVIPSTQVSGLSAPATAAFGSTAGTVADGGGLASAASLASTANSAAAAAQTTANAAAPAVSLTNGTIAGNYATMRSQSTLTVGGAVLTGGAAPLLLQPGGGANDTIMSFGAQIAGQLKQSISTSAAAGTSCGTSAALSTAFTTITSGSATANFARFVYSIGSVTTVSGVHFVVTNAAALPITLCPPTGGVLTVSGTALAVNTGNTIAPGGTAAVDCTSATACTWEAQDASTSVVQAPGAPVAVTGAVKSGANLTFEDFGLVGDGLTDNLAAWNTAISGFYSAACPTVRPAGTNREYHFSAPPTFPNCWNIDGRVGRVTGLSAGYSWSKFSAYAGGKAFGASLPNVGDSITLGGTCAGYGLLDPANYAGGIVTGGTTITFIAGSTNGTSQVALGTSGTAFVANLLSFLNASVDANITGKTYRAGYWTAAQLQSGSTPLWVLEVEAQGTGASAYSLGMATTTGANLNGPWSVTNGLTRLTTTRAGVNGGGTDGGGHGSMCAPLQGGGAQVQGTTISVSGGGPVVNTLGAVGGGLRNIYIVSNAVHSVPFGPMNDLVQKSAAYASGYTGLTLKGSYMVDNVGFLGWKTAMATTGAQWDLRNIRWDGWNGFDLAGAGDWSDLQNVEGGLWQGAYTQQAQNVNTTYTPGKGVAIHDEASGSKISNVRCYGCGIKFDEYNAYGITFDNPQADGPGTPSTLSGPAVLDVTFPTLASRGMFYVSPVFALSAAHGETWVTYRSAGGAQMGVISDVDCIDCGNWTGISTATQQFPAVPPSVPTGSFTDNYAGATSTVATAQSVPGNTLVIAAPTGNPANPAHVTDGNGCIPANTGVSGYSSGTLTVTLTQSTTTPCVAGDTITFSGGYGAAPVVSLVNSIGFRDHGNIKDNIQVRGGIMAVQDIGLQIKGTAGNTIIVGTSTSGSFVHSLVIGMNANGSYTGGTLGGGSSTTGPGATDINDVVIGPSATSWLFANDLVGCPLNGPEFQIDPTSAMAVVLSNVANPPSKAPPCIRDPYSDGSVDRVATLAAAGATQATAATLGSDINMVTSGAGGVIANLMVKPQTIANQTGSAVKVYAPLSATLNGIASATGASLAAGATSRLSCISATACFLY